MYLQLAESSCTSAPGINQVQNNPSYPQADSEVMFPPLP